MNASLTLALALALGVGSDPYIRSRVDTRVLNDPKAHCLWWNQQGAPLVFHQNDRGNPETTGETEFLAAGNAIATWQSAFNVCGHLQLQDGTRVSDRQIGYQQGSPDNRNIIVYRQRLCSDVAPKTDSCFSTLSCQNKYDCWDGQKSTIALTTTTYDVKTGEIIDADIEMNAASFVFTAVDSPQCLPPIYNQECVATDVQNTLTHEIGHALGLDHTMYSGSTMNPSAPSGEITKRVLDVGTQQFVCDAYPRGAPPRDCVIEPVDPELGQTPSCSMVGGPPLAFALSALALLRASRRRSRRP